MDAKSTNPGASQAEQPDGRRHRPRGPLAIAVSLLAIVGVGLLLWRLSHVLMLVFASMIVAAVLWQAAVLTERVTPLNRGWSKALSWTVIALIVAGFIFLMGTQIGGEFANLVEALPGLVSDLGTMLGVSDLSGMLQRQAQGAFDGVEIFGGLAGYTAAFFGSLGTLVVVIFGGVFLAANPQMYRRGLQLLVPAPWDGRVGEAADAAAQSLSQWLLGKLIAMLVIGAATTAGLLLIGVPSAIALGVLAGLLEFVPLVGPILSAIPALLVALPEGPDKVLWVLALYVGLQQVESNVLVPLVQQRTAELPPVLGLFALVAFTTLFGPVGIIVAAPLTIVLIALVKKLYVEDVLGRHPGKEADDPSATSSA